VWNRSMNSSSERRNILGELRRAEDILNNLLERLSELFAVLEPLESHLRLTDFSSSGMYIPGSKNAIICALTADIRGDPIHAAIELTKGKGLKLPAIIKGSDRSESTSTCESILKIIKTQLRSTGTKAITNLRWSSLPKVIDRDSVVIIGTRYSHAGANEIMRLKDRLKKLNLEVYEDDGEYGGGLLTYRLMKLVEEMDDVIVLEMTLSSSLTSDLPKVVEILEALSSL
jgi:hypothetical protein